MKRSNRWLSRCSFSALLALSLPAAQALNTAPGGRPEADVGSAGLGAAWAPAYAGARERKAQGLPLIDYRWKSGWFAGTLSGVGYEASSNPRLSFGPRLTVDLGRKENLDPRLRGLGDVKPQAELGGYFSFGLLPQLQISSSLRYGSGPERDGLLIEQGLQYRRLLGRRTALGLGLSATWANAEHLQAHFGVSPSQALRSRLPEYRPRDGLREVRLQLGLIQNLSPEIDLFIGLEGSRLGKQAKRSPLVQRADNAALLLGITHRF